MPLFEVHLEREVTALQRAVVTIEAPTMKEAHIRAIEDDYGEVDWEDLDLLDWTQPTVTHVFDAD